MSCNDLKRPPLLPVQRPFRDDFAHNILDIRFLVGSSIRSAQTIVYERDVITPLRELREPCNLNITTHILLSFVLPGYLPPRGLPFFVTLFPYIFQTHFVGKTIPRITLLSKSYRRLILHLKPTSPLELPKTPLRLLFHGLLFLRRHTIYI